MDGVIPSSLIVLAALITTAVWTGTSYLWRKGNKSHAALLVGSSVALGLLVSATWTLALLITGGFVFACSFVKTTGASVITLLFLLGLLGAFGFWLIS